MSVTIEQSVETATNLEIPVTITLGESGTFSHVVPTPTATGPKGSHWRVTWTLNPPDGYTAFFLEPPIIFTSPLPKGVDDYHLERLSPILARLTFTSNVFDVNVIRYDLNLEVHDINAQRLYRSKRIIIDPTIAIVEDPIGG